MHVRNRLRGLARGRRGKILVAMALLTPVLVGGLAVSVDTAVVAHARGQLQTAADAAALAGVTKLADDARVQRGNLTISSEIAAAQNQVLAWAPKNSILNSPAVVNNNTSNAPGGDVVIGYIDPTSYTSALSTAVPALFNSVQVTVSRDATHTGLVPSFFSSVLGNNGTSMHVSATGTAINSQIAGFRSVNGLGANLLPIVLDVTTYQAMLAGTTTDQYTYNSPTPPATVGTVSSGPDGITESQLYPVASGNPGNWGTINVGVSNNSTSILRSQILYGITPAQLATFPNGTISLDQADSGSTNPINGQSPLQYHTFSGNPGISAGIKSALTSIIGKPVSIPIYDQTGGNGNNAWYRVIYFAPCRILAVNFQGNPKYVIIQPALIKDPTGIPSGAPPLAWSSGGLLRIYLSR
jgi:Flp pilus assembly protein TadG